MDLKAQPERLTIRAVLLLGLGVTLGLWLLSGLSFSERLRQVRADAGAINSRFMQSQESLSTLRAQVLLSSVLVRDAFLAPNPSSIDDYRRRLERSFETADAALAQYAPVVDGGNAHARVAGLRAELAEFRRACLSVIAGNTTRVPADERLRLLNTVVPRRESTIRVSEEVQALNRGDFVQQQAALSDVYARMQRRVLQQFGLTLALSVVVGLIATRYAIRLERHLLEQRRTVAETARKLQRLSGELMTAQEHERRRIARELHDEVGQVLAAIKVDLAGLETALTPDAEALSRLASTRRLAEGAVQSIRDLSRLLHPSVLDDLGLGPALAAHAREFTRRYGILVEFREVGTVGRWPQEAEVAAYRIVQEALANVGRHSGASRCRVVLGGDARALHLTIEDNGRGFTLAPSGGGPLHGLGLISIRERAALLGGSATVTSTPGVGTQVVVHLPDGPWPARGDDSPAVNVGLIPREALDG